MLAGVTYCGTVIGHCVNLNLVKKMDAMSAAKSAPVMEAYADVEGPFLVVFDLDYTVWPTYVDMLDGPPFRQCGDGSVVDRCVRRLQQLHAPCLQTPMRQPINIASGSTVGAPESRPTSMLPTQSRLCVGTLVSPSRMRHAQR